MKNLCCTCLVIILMFCSYRAYSQPAQIVTEPVDFYACQETAASFTVSATGGNLVYQWFENNTLLVNSPNYSGVNTPTLSISNSTGLNGNAYHVVVTGDIGLPATSIDAILYEVYDNTWTGTVNSNWSSPMNWSCGVLPIVTTNVIIPGSAPNMPLIDIPGAICHSLLIDQGASIAFSGVGNQLEVRGDITNNGIYDGTNGITLLSGANTQSAPGTAYQHLVISGGGVKNFTGDIEVMSILQLDFGCIVLDTNDLILQDITGVLGGSATSFIVTGGTGVVKGQNMNADPSMFHVGINGGSYTPIMLENEGDADTFSVRVKESVYADGYGVNPLLVTSPVVNRTWFVTEETPGGSLVSMTPMWNAIDEVNGFDLVHVYIARYDNSQWMGYTINSQTAPAAVAMNGMWGTNYDSISTFSPFTVASSGADPLFVQSASDNVVLIDAYPNPAYGSLFINIRGANDEGFISIVDVLGRDIQEVKLATDPIEINLSGFEPRVVFC